MAAYKIKQITVSYPRTLKDTNVYGYRVEKTVDTTEFWPGQLLTRGEVDELCNSNNWKVTITKA